MQFPGDANNQYLPRMIWKPSNDALLVQLINRAQNNNKVYRCHASNGTVKLEYEDTENGMARGGQ